MLFKDLINERYVNAIGDSPEVLALKNHYKNQVWDILQSTYKPIGGIKGSGFRDPDDMVQNIPFWKLAVKDGKVHAVILYKDKDGRKSVASGTAGTDYGKERSADIMRNDPVRAYGEKSKAALGALMKQIPWDQLKSKTMTPAAAEQILGDPVTPIKDVPEDKWPSDAKMTLAKYPQLVNYGYLRELGGTMIFKVMFGSVGNTIK
jgi:hypothetical protein